MHVVAAKPRYLDASQVPVEVLKQETDIFRELSEKEFSGTNKKPEILEKMLQGAHRAADFINPSMIV